MPDTRPDRTFRAGSRHPIGYVDSNPDGDDGAPAHRLRRDRLAGGRHRPVRAARPPRTCASSASRRSTRERDVGPSALLVAARLCRERHALLVVDPPAAWQTCDEALQGLREFDVPLRPRVHVLPAHPGVRPAARPLRRRSPTAAPWPARWRASTRSARRGTAGRRRARSCCGQAARPRFALHRCRAGSGSRRTASTRCSRCARPARARLALKTLAGGAARELRPAACSPPQRRQPAADGQHRARHALGRVRAQRASPCGSRLARQVQAFLRTLDRDRRCSGRRSEAGAFEVDLRRARQRCGGRRGRPHQPARVAAFRAAPGRGARSW
ncbi:MAG: hypothetical protein MZV70_43105 [Desulfobacterales bacterium]|nr:hypothetical protein [Desulfobacterales bacterium]